MKISELRTIASDIGEKKIVGMIKKEVTKARKDDGMVAICDMVDGLLAAIDEKKKERASE